MQNAKSKHMWQIILYYGSTSLIPSIFLFFLYNANSTLKYIRFDHTIVLAGMFAVMGIGIYAGFCFLSRSQEGAMLIAFLFWVFFWTYEALYAFVIRFVTVPRVLFFLGLVGFVVLLASFFRRHGIPFYKGKSIFRALAIIFISLFVFNFSTALRTEILLSRGQHDYYIKQNFNVDKSLPSPDIYWFHLDGMLSFFTIEEFFGDDQAQLRQQLREWGFVINENAKLNSGQTIWAIPALQSPAFYDNWLGGVLEDAAHLFEEERHIAIENRFLQYGFNVPYDIAPYNELFAAFGEAGYTRAVIGSPNLVWWPPRSVAEFFYSATIHGVYPPMLLINEDLTVQSTFLERIADLVELLSLTTPISNFGRIFDAGIITEPDWTLFHDEHTFLVDQLTKDTLNHPNERAMHHSLIDSLSIESPKLILMTSFITHSAYFEDFVEPSYFESLGITDLYLTAHRYSIEITLRQIDMILANNPNAVIVLQSDHGLRRSEYFLERGLSKLDSLSITDSVFSAVRIPLQYGGLSAPLDPRNITRVLVNRFVGENYELLPD